MEQVNSIISILQDHYNVLEIFHPSCPQDRRVFIVNSFTPAQGLTHFHDLRGKEITDLLSESSFYSQFSMIRQTGVSTMEFKTAQFDTKLDELPLKHFQFAPDFTWVWYLSA